MASCGEMQQRHSSGGACRAHGAAAGVGLGCTAARGSWVTRCSSLHRPSVFARWSSPLWGTAGPWNLTGAVSPLPGVGAKRMQHSEHSVRGHGDPSKGPRFRAPPGAAQGLCQGLRVGVAVLPQLPAHRVSAQDRSRRGGGELLCSPSWPRPFPSVTGTPTPMGPGTTGASRWPSLGLTTTRVSHVRG